MGRKKTKRVSKKQKPKQKFSLKKSKKRMISKKRYQQLIEKRQHNVKLTLNERKQLDHALFVNYCSCVKSLKYNEKKIDQVYVFRGSYNTSSLSLNFLKLASILIRIMPVSIRKWSYTYLRNK